MSVLKGYFNGSTFQPRCAIAPVYIEGKSIMDFSGMTPAAITTGSIFGTGSVWIAHSTVGSCGIKLLLSYTGASGDFASLRIRARSNGAGNVSGGNFSASAGQNNYGDLRAVEGYAQPNAYTQSGASNIVCGLYGCIDRTSGGTSSGRDWVAWIDTHMQVKAAGGSYLMRLSHNGTIANDGAISVYSGGRMPVLFHFEDAAGFLLDSDGSHTVASGAIAVKTPAGTKYIVLYT